MTYSTTQIDAASNALCAELHGLHFDVAHAWVTAEQGIDYNMVGLTHYVNGQQTLYQYTSYADAAQHIAAFIYGSPYYVGIVNSLSGTSQQQAAAIVASPWNHPYYSTGSGAAALRAIAATPTPTSTPRLYTLVFRGRTPVSATGGGASVSSPTPIYSMTAVGEQHLIGGHWWYKIVSAPLSQYVGKWVEANGRFTATPK